MHAAYTAGSPPVALPAVLAAVLAFSAYTQQHQYLDAEMHKNSQNCSDRMQAACAAGSPPVALPAVLAAVLAFSAHTKTHQKPHVKECRPGLLRPLQAHACSMYCWLSSYGAACCAGCCAGILCIHKQVSEASCRDCCYADNGIRGPSTTPLESANQSCKLLLQDAARSAKAAGASQ